MNTVTNARELRAQLRDHVLSIPAGAASLGEIIEDLLGLNRGATSAHVANWPTTMRNGFTESINSGNPSTADATWWAIVRYLDSVR